MPNPVLAALGRPFRLGIAGGAPPSMIGPVHRVASAMDQRFTLVAGVLSSRPERSLGEGTAIGLSPDRCYGSVEDMIAREAARPDGIEALSIVTPNDSHARYVRAGLAAGLDLMIEKPLCNSLTEARELAELARGSGRAIAITHTYSGYPMLRDMRARIDAGEIGVVRLVQVDYLTGGLATRMEDAPDADKRWRLKPEIGGPSLVLGDIGTHAHHLACFVTGLPVEAVSAHVGTLVPGRVVHDLAQVRLLFRGGARGRIEACNAAAGMSNQLLIRVFGETGHMEWQHRDNGKLAIASLDGDVRIVASGQANLTVLAQNSTHLRRMGHPEGLQEAVANLYLGLSDLMLERRGYPAPDVARLTPGIDDGVAGLAFVEACLESSARDGALTPMPTEGKRMATILITGCDKGLGREFARQYAADGHRVFATCLDPTTATDTAAIGGEIDLLGLDVTDHVAIGALAERLRGVAIDVLVSNAGLGHPHRGFGQTDYGHWRKVLETNLIGPMKLAESFVEHVAQGEHRVMAFVSSRMGSIGSNLTGGVYGYRTSKAGLNMMVRSLAVDLAPRRICTIALHPGWADSEPGGRITMAESVAGMRGVIHRAGPHHTGSFLTYHDQLLPW